MRARAVAPNDALVKEGVDGRARWTAVPGAGAVGAEGTRGVPTTAKLHAAAAEAPAASPAKTVARTAERCMAGAARLITGTGGGGMRSGIGADRAAPRRGA